MFDIQESPGDEATPPAPEDIESFGRLTSGVAHEFNNLLTAILGHVVLCRSQVETGHPIDQDLSRIEQASERAVELARRLMATARAAQASTQR
jgi:signal transduction histidine kinase